MIPLKIALATTLIASVTCAEGNAKMGKKTFRKCESCHSLESGENKVGPSLYSIFGREAGTEQGFKYSQAMANATFIWNEKSLNNYLENPKKYLRGTKMTFNGLKKQSQRDNVIEYLKNTTGFDQTQ